jgi:CRP-like cAMP-binding protein
LENYEKGGKIFNRGSECNAIYFLVNGEIDLIVEAHGSNKEHILDILLPGSIIGQYSVINESPF